jgi:hypothetical protein
MSTNGQATEARMNPVAPEVQQVIRSTEQELARLLRRRDEIARRMNAIKQMLPGLAELFGARILDGGVLSTFNRERGGARQKGLTRACRVILVEARTPLRVAQGCEELRRRFPEVVERHKDLRASVTTVFHRLQGYGEAHCFLDDEGWKVWEWVQRAGSDLPQPSAGSQSPDQGFAILELHS